MLKSKPDVPGESIGENVETYRGCATCMHWDSDGGCVHPAYADHGDGEEDEGATQAVEAVARTPSQQRQHRKLGMAIGCWRSGPFLSTVDGAILGPYNSGHCPGWETAFSYQKAGDKVSIRDRFNDSWRATGVVEKAGSKTNHVMVTTPGMLLPGSFVSAMSAPFWRSSGMEARANGEGTYYLTTLGADDKLDSGE